MRQSPRRRPQAAPRAALIVAWLSVAASLAGFLLPWVTLDLRGAKLAALAGGGPHDIGRVTIQLRQGGETIAAALPEATEFPWQVRGIQIPWLVRQEQTRVAVALLERLTNTRQHAALKSGAVFLVPGAALLCGVLLTGWGRHPAVAGGVLLVCVAVAAGGAWKLLALDTSRSLIGVAIERGLWVSLGAYVGLAASAAWTGMSGRGRT
ncbi:MAG: hypothetical protein A3B78_02840 [Omnitrophica WOR_2 bacterium RIFCSPHIGHO2_02_FULL_67_20]|nr:MAG: hypothetical protein A3B78_02840 [Omnitrophica WOR_2 bacterium RIFCSPHIGHO2_02_FULL_67_20]